MSRMAKKSKAETDPDLDVPLKLGDMHQDDTLVLVLGETGAGKSTFINCAIQRDGASVGHSLNPETRTILPFIANHPTHPGRRLILVDTPGFNSALWNDYTVIQRLSKWLKQSLPPRSWRRVVMVYLFDIGQHIWKGSAGRIQLQTWCRGIADNLIIATTKWELTSDESGRRRERVISDIYGRKIYSFHNTQTSAWEIIGRTPINPLDVSNFLFELAGTRHLAEARVNNSVSRSLSMPLLRAWATRVDSVGGTARTNTPQLERALPGAGQDQPEEAEESPGTSVLSRLEEIRARLMTAFVVDHEYERLLSYQGPEAQALLDTLQSIMRLGSSDGHFRRSLVVLIKKLSSKVGLYPKAFFLTDVWRSELGPVASGSYADIYKGTLQGKLVCLKIIRVYKTSSYERIVKPDNSPGSDIMGQLSLIFPWAEKGNIVEFLNANPVEDRVLLCLDVARGVAHLHENDVIHGALKGMNVLVDAASRAYLADFGLSGVEDPDILYWASQSSAAATASAVRWQAPELFEYEPSGNEEGLGGSSGPRNTMASDVYAWTCVCYEVREGARPRASKEQYTVWGLTEEIWALMNDCWAREPASRPTIQQALSRLDALRPKDHRLPGEWKEGPAMQKEGLSDSDVPLTLETLNDIITLEASR